MGIRFLFGFENHHLLFSEHSPVLDIPSKWSDHVRVDLDVRVELDVKVDLLSIDQI